MPRLPRLCRPAAASTLLLALGFAAGRAETPALPFLRGVDLSSATLYEAQGVAFKDDGQAKPLLQIFRDHGVNAVRLRLFVHPTGRGEVVNDLPYTLPLARRVKALGYVLLLDLHYSDTWADPGHQATPAAWTNLDLPHLADQVRNYTAEVIDAFAKAGATPDLVQVGNEINNGLLWPLGSFAGKSQAEAYDNIAALLNAGIAGVHQVEPAARIVLHAANGERTDRVRHFFDELARRHVAFDIVGLSYYPLRGTLDEITATLNSTAKACGKPVLIVETASPWRESPQRGGPATSLAWPRTPEGQKAFLLDLIKTLRAVPDGLGAGFFYWHPDAVRAGALPLWRGGDMALFDDSDNALPALEAFQPQP